jgi:DNA-binding transcriptional MerR regulator
MRLKKHYSSREVAALTGLSARQLQWWDTRRLFVPAIRSHRTEAGGFTERRYTPMDVLELQVLAELRRRGFSIPQLRRLLSTLRDAFGIRLYEAIGEGGPMALFVGGDQLYARTEDGQMFNMDRPSEPLLMVGEELSLRPLAARERRRRRRGTQEKLTESGTPSRGRRQGARSRGRR